MNVVRKHFEKNGFEVYLVGGCVRDLLMGKEPKDWDITTSAKPEKIITLFEKTIYENNFGTVGVKIKSNVNGQMSTVEVVEVTTFHLNIAPIVEFIPVFCGLKYPIGAISKLAFS